MKRIMTVLLAAMMLFGGLHLVAAEEIIETAVPEEALLEEVVAEEPAAEEAAEAAAEAEVPAEEPVVEEPVVEEPAAEEPVAEPVEEAPVQEPVEEAPVAEPVVEAPVVEAPAQEPVAEPVTEVPVQESVAEEKVAEQTEVQSTEEAAPSFTGTLKAETTEEPAVKGEPTFVVATVADANMAYSIQWELKVEEEWEAIKEANVVKYEFIADMPAGSYNYRAVLTAEDGTVLTDNVIVTVVEPEEATTEEVPAEEQTEAEEPAAEEEVAEEPVAEEPAAEEPAAEEAATEEEAADSELAEIEDYDTALGLPGAEPEPEKKVTISVVRNGNKIDMTSVLEGLDGYEVTYQWECDKHDGTGFQTVAGANEGTYSVDATSETLKWEWRLVVGF